MSITRSQIARQMYANGALVDPRMANTFEQNKAINDANTVIGNSLRQLGLTQRHFDAVDKMKRNPSAYGIENQLDYAIKSGGDLVSGANQTLKPLVALGQGLASPVYDYYQALKKYSDKGYQGEFGLSKQGITDFFKNLGLVAKEYDDQNPLLMAAGRTYGGLKETFSPTTSEGITSLNTTPTPNEIIYDNQGRKIVTEDMIRNTFKGAGYNGEDLKAAFGDNVTFVGDNEWRNQSNNLIPFFENYGTNAYRDTRDGSVYSSDVYNTIKSGNEPSYFHIYNPYSLPVYTPPASLKKGGRAGFAYGGDTGGYDEAGISTPSSSFDFGGPSVGGGGGNDETRYLPTTAQLDRLTPTSSFDTNVNNVSRTLGVLGAAKNLVQSVGAKGLMSFPGAIAALELYNVLKGNDQNNALKGNDQNYAKGGRAGYAYGGSTYDEAGTTTPSSSFDFSPSDSGGGGNDEVSYYPTTAQLNATLSGGDGGGGGEDAITNYITPPTKPFTPAADKNKILDIILKNQEEDKRLPAPEPSLFEKFIDVAKYVVAPEVAAIEYGINKFGPPAYTIDRGFNPNAAPTSKTASQTFNQMKSGGTYDVPYTGGGDNQPIIPILPVQTPTDVDNELSDFDIYMQSLGQNRFSLDPRFAAAEGGRARRGYGIGGIIKSVGKAVKKVLKSDVGKAAIGLASLYYGPKLFGEPKGFTSWKNVNFLKSMQNNPLPWILGGSAVAGLTSSEEEEDNLDQISDRRDESGLKELIATYKPLRFQVQKPYQLAAQGGRIGYAEGGMMDLGGMEKDYRAEGGFVPIGKAEKADDVPARLSKNEFVFTADAVRSAGDGDIDKGAEVMYNVMKNLESGGKISDESQGLQGARDMFQTSQRLGEIL